jgi:ubiquinone/menaquinone biosynthesis C-methylase UbiE
VDLVISNGVINLCPDTTAVFCEAFRVLKPGGRIQIGDIIVNKDIPPAARENVEIWTA